MKSHGRYKCEICLVLAKIGLAWADTTTEKKKLKHVLTNNIASAKFYEDGVHLCGVHRRYRSPSRMLREFKSQLEKKLNE